MYEDLDELIAKSNRTAEVFRALAVKNDLAGMARGQIALLLDRSVSFVSKWRLIHDQYGADGLVSLHQGGGPRALLSEADKQAVYRYIRSRPQMGVTELRVYLQARYGVSYRSNRSYHTLLRQAGLSYHKSQKTNAKHDPALVRQRRKIIKKNSGRSTRTSSKATR
jgi:putative transposase